jgi:hypothetical protein
MAQQPAQVLLLFPLLLAIAASPAAAACFSQPPAGAATNVGAVLVYPAGDWLVICCCWGTPGHKKQQPSDVNNPNHITRPEDKHNSKVYHSPGFVIQKVIGATVTGEHAIPPSSTPWS